MSPCSKHHLLLDKVLKTLDTGLAAARDARTAMNQGLWHSSGVRNVVKKEKLGAKLDFLGKW